MKPQPGHAAPRRGTECTLALTEASPTVREVCLPTCDVTELYDTALRLEPTRKACSATAKNTGHSGAKRGTLRSRR
jgi:hypothetical protein